MDFHTDLSDSLRDVFSKLFYDIFLTDISSLST